MRKIQFHNTCVYRAFAYYFNEYHLENGMKIQVKHLVIIFIETFFKLNFLENWVVDRKIRNVIYLNLTKV